MSDLSELLVFVALTLVVPCGVVFVWSLVRGWRESGPQHGVSLTTVDPEQERERLRRAEQERQRTKYLNAMFELTAPRETPSVAEQAKSWREQLAVLRRIDLPQPARPSRAGPRRVGRSLSWLVVALVSLVGFVSSVLTILDHWDVIADLLP